MELTQEDAQAQLQEMMPMAEELFRMSEMFIKKRGSFLPHAARMDNFDQIAFVGAATENEMTNSEEVLPILHEGLRIETGKASTLAVAVCEYVFIGEDRQPAIKVLAEHRAGGCFALYLPFKKRLLRKPTYGDIQIMQAAPEVGGWPGTTVNSLFG